MRHKMQYLEAGELLKVLTEAKRKGTREHCMFLMAYHHGLRASEIARLTLDSVKGGKLNVRRLKGSLHTIQPIVGHNNPLLDEKRVLQSWLQDRGDADQSRILFISRQGSGLTRQQVRNLFEDVAMRAGIESGRRTPHILKHTLASHLIRNGADTAYVQQALGHADPKSTLSYTHITDNEAAVVKNAVLGRVFA